MKVRAQISMVFHLDKCIGCHTCSLACKNLWTNAPGREYMWWNNVETKPGTGYPTLYEDQEKYHGGWERTADGKLRLRLGSRLGELASIFFNPRLPTLDDYYEPWTYTYGDLFFARPDEDQPVAKPISLLSGREISIEAGPNWDDDLGGSGIYAANDPNLADLTAEERKRLFGLERIVFFYLPRICNHCLNPGCLGACPAGAIYKRGEDGIVLVNQDKCRAWRMCVSGCPYKKTYFNWNTGKAEKCILCYPRQETQQVPGCMHSCVGRIRYLGVLLYDAERIHETASRPDNELVESQREMILDPFDPQVVRQAALDGVHEKMVESAQHSPVYSFVKRWKIALPHHPEWRTLPMLFYVPPLLPVAATVTNGRCELAKDLFSSLENARLPLAYLARLFTAGDVSMLTRVYRKLLALRLFKRAQSVGDISEATVQEALREAETTPEELEAIYQATAVANFGDRFLIPPFLRETAVETTTDLHEYQGREGTGFLHPPERGL
jgi:nitrate reductase / nitrite oxidoreductase, beta subunit